MSDEIIWQVIDKQFCSYKVKATRERTFCRNEMNISGLCSRTSCPLANSRYATIRPHPDPTKAINYLYIKTPERAHMPSKLWQKIKLSQNYQQALAQIEEHLKYWPQYMIHRAKQRLTRLQQVSIRMRRLAKEEARLGERIVPKLAPKVKRREATRERKAEAAAKLERAIERELLGRLREGAYGDQPLNVSEQIWKKVLNAMEREGEATRDKDLDTGIEDEDEDEREEEFEMDDEEEDGAVEYVSDFEESDEDDLDDLEDWLGSDESGEEESETDETDEDSEDASAKKKSLATGDKRKRAQAARAKPKKMPRRRREIEHEHELEHQRPELAF
ncbi:ribosomal L28e protein family-domain-containing protein [Xylaria bambusicola]|uniref:ribosomal L28e protein family-domain-containing protein n=1 Tax=Xylaria bambusicola TaxID=326684 RepID=UPI002007391F|nr:ribosomal L28e protein family-domain-containing protein [Xylaria bambusicola]KAI0517663.1 ribosomal L28e protein family-domain-containing protein [Xylaria bambusicola]